MTVGGTQMPPRVSTGDWEAVLRQIRWCALRCAANWCTPFTRSAVGMEIPMGIPIGMGMGIEIPSHGSPAVYLYLCSDAA